MRLVLTENSKAVSYCHNGKRYFEITEDSPSSVLKDFFWDCLSVLRNGKTAVLCIDGEGKTLTAEVLRNVLERFDTDCLLEIRSSYITEGDWRFVPPAEYSIGAWVEKIVTEREHKDLGELNALREEHYRSAAEERAKFRESKNFQKLLRGLEMNPLYSQECKELLRVMKALNTGY